MSHSIYEIIHLRKDKHISNVKNIFFVVLIISGILAGTNYMPIQMQSCFTSSFNSSIYYVTFTVILPEFIILVLILHYYSHIRATLKIQIQGCELLYNTNRNYFKRIYGYNIIYILFFISNATYFIQYYFQENSMTISEFRITFLGFYPLMNSMIYGMTESSKNTLKNAISNNPSYFEYEETLQKLRDEQIILSRPFFDIIGVSDQSMLKKYDFINSKD